MNTARTHLLTGTLCVLGALLAGCSAGSGNGLGDAGKQSSQDPQAVITPVGHVPDADGTLHVRSGAEVVLSSKDSNGVDSAVLSVSWSAVNAAAQAVKMLERGATAMSFRAPVAPEGAPLELRFQLTVRTADGDTDNEEIRVLVDRVPDPNDFLLSDAATTNDAVNLVVVASSATGAASFTTDIPFTISVQKQVRYKRAIDAGPNPSTSPAASDPLYCASTDPLKTCVKIGAPLQLSGAWKAASGVAGTLRLIGTPLTTIGAAWQNPRFRLRPPSMNADEVNFAVLTEGIPTNFNGTGVPASDTRRNNLLYTADIGEADAEYVITLASPDLGALNRRPAVLVFAADATAPTGLAALAEVAAPSVAEPAVATITETQALNSIKTAPGVVESRDTALAYYDAIDPTGARDTVDKWLRDNCFQPELAGRPGYYGSDIQSTYLNDRDLGFGREMYFKTDCSTAQRGATNATLNTNAGERASIVFNYPSLEAAIKRSGSFLAVAMEYRADAGGGPKYTRFYTFAPDPRTRVWKRVTSANFDGRRERYTPGNCTVCHGGKPRASYAGGGELGATFIPWDANALLFADTDPSIVDQRLLPGFSRADQLPFIKALNQQGVQPIIDSRVADTAASGETLARWNAVSDLLAGWYPAAGGTNYNYVPASWQGGTSTGSASLSSSALYSQVFAENCRMCHMQRITEPGVSGLAVATAPQFNAFADVDGSLPIETTRLKERIFEQHVMPASRLTSDRFWIAQAGASQSGAQVLAAHLGLTLPAAKPAVTAVVETPPTDVDPGQASANVRLSALKSRFASSYSWTLQGPAGSNAVLVGANAAEPAFRADVSGTYTLNLTVRDADGNTNTLAPPLSIVADRKPVGGSYTITPNPTSGQVVSLDLFTTGGARPGDGSHTAIILSQPTGSGASLPTGCVTSCVLGFTATASGTIRYRLTDADGDQVDGEVFVTVSVPNQWSPRTYHGGVAFDDSVTCASGVNACARVVSGLDPTALARAALNLTVQQYNALNYTASVSFNQLPFRTGRVARPALQTGVTATNTSVTYTSPPLFVSSQDTLGNQMRDSFSYSIVVRDAGNNVVSQSLQDSVQMTVNPRARWSTTLATLQSLTCNSAGCHQAAPDYSIRSWGFAAYQPGTVAYDTYEQLGGIFRTSCPTGEAGATPFCVDYNNPAGSLLLQKPQGQYTHTGGGAAPGQPGALLTAGQLALIEDWIRDGAYRN